MRLIDAEFEEQHYVSMILNATPDVTENDKRNAKIIIDALKMAKTIEPERKKGKWIKGQDVPNRNPYFHLYDALYCSVCHNEAYWDTDYGQQIFDFCPNCGADMRDET